jgi:hypothetical protein
MRQPDRGAFQPEFSFWTESRANSGQLARTIFSFIS